LQSFAADAAPRSVSNGTTAGSARRPDGTRAECERRTEETDRQTDGYGTESETTMEPRRIVVTMGFSENGEGVFLPHTPKGEEVELAEDLAGALQSCFERPCERLYVSLLSADPGELTSLALFRNMRPSQYVVLVVDPSILPIVRGLRLANEYLAFNG
jgi:hypothetical protein